ncbi:hypothetical protein [Labrys okinawensis]|nr:hypothetical protein [Labrys okinawensis]
MELGQRHALVRRPLVWTVTGAVMAGVPAFIAAGEEPALYLALAFAGAVVARISAVASNGRSREKSRSGSKGRGWLGAKRAELGGQ